MAETLSIGIPKPVGSFSLGNQNDNNTTVDYDAARKVRAQAKQQKMEAVCTALSQAVKQIDQLRSEIIEQSKEQLARLAVEIAEIILKDKISNKEYNIEKIISETIKEAPDRQNIEIHISPEDFADSTDLIEKNPKSPLAGLKLVSDAEIGKAQCRVITQKGIIDCLIDEQLEQISQVIINAGK